MGKPALFHHFLPCDYLDTAFLEQWLSEMAGKGCHLVSISFLGGKFQEGAPKETAYCIIPYVAPWDLEKDWYIPYGWTYTTNAFNCFYIVESTGKTAQPLPIYPFKMTEAKKNYRKDKLIHFMVSIIVLLCISFLLYSNSSQAYRLSEIILYDAFRELLFLPFLLTCAGIVCLNYVRFLQQAKALEKGTIPATIQKTGHRRLFQITLLCLMLLLPTFALHRFHLATPESRTIVNISEKPIPLLPLAQLEGDAPSENLTARTFYTVYPPTVFTAQKISIWSQWDQMENTGSSDILDNVFIQIEYTKLKKEGLAPPLFDCLTASYGEPSLSVEGFDMAYGKKSPSAQTLVLVKDDVVMEILYRGRGDLFSHLEGLSLLIAQDYSDL